MINISGYSSKYYFPNNKNCYFFLLNLGSFNYVKEIIKLNNVKNIYYKSENLDKILKSNINFLNIEKVKLQDNFFLSFIQLLLIFLKIKLKNNFVFFFHESSWLEFDILLNIIKPKGYHYLTSVVEKLKIHKKINNFFHLPNLSISKKIFYSIIKFFFKKFNFYYRKKNINNNLPIFVFCNFYNSKIQKYYFLIKKKSKNKQKKILFLVSIDLISLKNNIKQVKIYNNLIDTLCNLGYQCFIKDHPNKSSRLNLLNKNCKQLNHQEPIEISNYDFKWVIGASSTSLFNFTNSISIIKIYMKDKYYKELNFFFLRSKADHVLMPASIKKIINLINKDN